MNHFMTEPISKFKITRLGLEQNSPLNMEEWQNLGAYLGSAARSMAFVIGDWVIFGNTLMGTAGQGADFPQTNILVIAAACTGLDIPTLEDYAHVSRKVPIEWRNERLSWEQHRVIAKLPPNDRLQWINTCVVEENSGRHMTLRRLRKSINLGRIATPADLEPDPADKGIENHLTYVNRLSVWWRHMQGDLFLSKSTYEQRQALKRDLEPVVNIYNQL
jgi:hypothetical protein